MATALSAPKGTKDILPDEARAWQYVEAIARALLPRYRYREVRTPIFESTELFSRGIGENTDIVGKEMYSFLDKGERPLTLRPENTAGVVRAYVEHKLYTEPAPQKFWYLGPMFRYERPQAGRQRQFHQLGVECFGSDDPRHDAEVIALAEALLTQLGIGALEVQLNSVGCPACRPAYRDRLQTYLRAHAADLCENCVVRTEKNPLRVLDCKVPSCAPTIAGAPPLSESLCETCRTHQASVERYLDAVGVRYTINPRLVRGLDYYTRTVFEIVSGQLGAQNTVLAGGRYNGLVGELGGPDTPAVGWGMGLERLLMLLPANAVSPERLDAFVMPAIAAAELPAFEIGQRLRGAGLTVEVASPGKLGNLFKQAERAGARYAIVLGEDELAAGELTVKELATRAQTRLAPDALLAHLTQGVGV